MPHASPDLADLRSRYLAAQLEGNRREALRLVVDEGLGRGSSVPEVRRRVIEEAQREIGRMWQENRITVAQEHMATAIAQLALAHLYEHAPRARANGKKVVVACVDGEQHDFPARLVADALDLAGFDVRYLGASVPTDDLVATVLAESPDLVALSATMTFNLPSLRAAAAALRAATDGRARLAIGGSACVRDANPSVGLEADVTGDDAGELVAAAQRLFGITEVA